VSITLKALNRNIQRMNESNEPNPTNVPAPSEYGAFVGVDWGDEEHAVSLRAANGTVIERRSLQQTPEALAQWLNTLRTRFANQKIAIALEQSRGPLLAGLTQYEHVVIFPVNPKSLARFREALYPSRSKDDLGDADLLLEFLLKHRDHLRPWHADTVQTRQLTLLNEQRRNFVDSRTELTNRLLAHLKMIFPQAIDLVGGDFASLMAGDFLKKWPSLQALQKVSPSNLRKFYYGHNSRSKDLIAQRLELVKNAVALTTDAALVAAHSLAIQTIASQLAGLHPFIEKYDAQIAELFAAHPDAYIFDGLPGAGPSLAPRLLTSLGTDRARFPSAVDVSCYTGIAPVTEQSGKSKWVHIRWSCPKFLRQSWHEFANCSIRFCPWACHCYNEYRKRNIDHQEAIRKLAFKWQRIVWRMWQDRQPYDEARYEAALFKKRGPKTSATTSQADSLSGEQKK
jgi:transposase